MIITLPEVTRAIYGAFRLLRLDRSGYSLLDDSDRGFAMSFWSAIFVLPGYFVLGHFAPEMESGATSPARQITVDVLHYIVGWTAYPVAMYFIAAHLGRPDRYRLYVVAYNWAVVPQVFALTTAAMLVRSGLLPPDAGSFVSLVLTFGILFWIGFLARTALDVPLPMAAGIVGFDILLTISLEQLRQMMI